MSSHKLAVVVIHGMGSQYRSEDPPASTTPTFSKGLKRKVARRVGAEMDDVIWHEVVWAQVFQERQKNYLKKINRSLGYDKLRQFVVYNLSDAASYRPSEDDKDVIYEKIHEKIKNVMGVVKFQVGESGPVLIIAHSLGGHIMSNYIYDMQRHLRTNEDPIYDTDVENMKTVAGFITFGCNIPIFLFGYPEGDIYPIKAPNQALPGDLQFPTWWYNYYDRHDVLGYPLGKYFPRYVELKDNGALKDKAINAGKIFTSWNPLSHNGYWTDRDFYEPVADRIKEILDAV